MERVGYMPQDITHNLDAVPRPDESGEKVLSSEFDIRPKDRTKKMALVALFGLATAGFAARHEFGGENEHKTSQEQAKPDDFLVERLASLEQESYIVNLSGVFINQNRLDQSQRLKNNKVNSETRAIRELQRSFVEAAYPIVPDTKPLDYINEAVDVARKNGSKSVKIPAYELTVGQTGNSVQLRNLLTGVVVKNFNVDFSSSEELKMIQEEVSRAIGSDKDNLIKTYSGMLESKHIPAEAMDITEVHAGNGFKQMKDLLQREDVQSIEVGGWKTGGGNEGDRDFRVTFRKDFKGELPNEGSLQIPGLLTDISFKRVAKGMTPPDWAAHGEGTQILPGEDGALYTVETVIDQTSHKYEQIVNIKVPLAISSQENGKEIFVGRSIDGTPVNLPLLKDVVFERAEHTLAERENSGFKFSFYFEGEDQSVWEPYYDQITRSIVSTQEAFYGKDPKFQFVKKIRIFSDTDTTEKNGVFQPRFADTIALTSAHMLPLLSNNNEVGSTTEHEFIHAVGENLNLNQDNEALADLYQKSLKDAPALLRIMAEENWGKKGIGGHLEDNPAEFFASSLHALLVDNLEEVMTERLNSTTAVQIIEEIQGLRPILIKAYQEKHLSTDVKIFERFDQAEKIARKIIVESSDKQVASK